MIQIVPWLSVYTLQNNVEWLVVIRYPHLVFIIIKLHLVGCSCYDDLVF